MKQQIKNNTNKILLIAVFIFLIINPLLSQETGTVTICGGSTSIGSNVGPNTGTWTAFKGTGTFGDPGSKQTTVSNTAFGENIYRYTISGVIEKVWTVTNYKANAGSDINSCPNLPFQQLNGCDPTLVANTSGNWTCISANCAGVTITDPSLYNTTVSGLQPGNSYTFRWTLTTVPAICAPNFDDIVINISAATIANAGPDKTICPGANTTLTASGGVSYLWSTGQTNATITVNPLTNTNYSVTVTDAIGCSGNDDVQVFIDNLNVYNISASSTTYCSGGTGVSIFLSGSETGVNYQLKQFGVNTGAPIAGDGTPLTWFNKTLGTYTIDATRVATGCTKSMSGSLNISTNPLPTQYALPLTRTYCSHTTGASITLTGSENGTNFQYQIYKNGFVDGPPLIGNGLALTWNNKTIGNYTVRATNTNTGCSQMMTNTTVVSILQSPELYNVTGSNTYCQSSGGIPVILDNSETGTNYQLYKDGLASGGVIAGNTGSTITWPGQNYGTYTVTGIKGSCSRPMNSSATLTEIPLPAVYDLSGPSFYCAGTNGVTLTLSGSQVGTNYNLKNGGVLVSTLAGTGGPLTWINILAGTYTVDAETTGGVSCSKQMNGIVTISSSPLINANAGPDRAICNGKSAQLLASGGNTYAWSPALGLDNPNIANPQASPTATTMYTVTVTDIYGCTATDQAEVVVRALPTVVTNTNTTICNGQPAILTATDNIIGNNETYLWNTGSTYDTTIVRPSTNTTYYVTITDVFGCSNSASVNVIVNPGPGVNAGSDTKVCRGSSVTLTGTGNADTWEWNTGGITPSIVVSPVANSNYILKGTFTATGCYTLDTVFVTVNSLPITTFTLNGGNNTQFCVAGPAITLAGSPAGGGFTSSAAGAISGNSFNTTIAGVGNHSITYTYTDVNNCTGLNTTNIDVFNPPTVTIAGLNAQYCNNSVAFTITGNPLQDGNGNYGTWTFSGPAPAITDNGNGTATINPALISIAGTYTVTYQVANLTGCIGTKSSTFTVNIAPTVNYVGLPASICQNDAPVNITGSPTGATGIFTGSGITNNGNGTAIFNPQLLAANTYPIVYTYTDPVTSCQTTISKNIIVKPIPAIYTVGGGGSYCQGGAGLPITLSNSTIGIDYELLLNTNTTGLFIPGTGALITYPNQLLAGNYTISARNNTNSCSVLMNGSATITINPLPNDAPVITGNTSVCPETSHTYSIPAINNAASYIWQLPANATITSGLNTNSITVLYASNAVSGNISVYGQNPCGNGTNSSLPVTIRPLPAPAGIITGKTNVCQGEKNVVYTVPVIVDATSYNWTVPSGAGIISGQGTNQIVVNYSNTGISGNITVTGINNCGNGTSNALAITVTATPQITANPPSGQINCSGAAITVSASSTTAGVSYLWTAIDGGNITGVNNTSTATVSTAGKYIIKITEPLNSCAIQDTITVTSNTQAPENINITSTNAGVVTCTVPQITLTATTTSGFPVSYQWTALSGGNIVSGIGTATPIVDKAGVYQVKVTNLNTNCFDTKSITISELKAVPNIVVTDPDDEKLTCTKTTVTLNSSSSTSGVTYNWSGPGIVSGGNANNPVVNTTGTYTLTVTAPNGCTSVATVQVLSDYSLPTISVINNPGILTCTDTLLTLNGSSSTTGATYLWSGPGIKSGPTTQTPVVNKPGTYILTVTHPITGCTITDNIIVTQNITIPVVSIPVLPQTITCGQLNVTITGSTSATNKTWKWTTSTGTIVSGENTQSIVVSKGGTYSLLVTDTDNGCTATTSVIATENKTLPDAQIATPQTITCTTPSVILSGSSATTPVSANWTTTDGIISSGAASFNPTVTKGGTYTITVTNTTTLCSATASVSVIENKNLPLISINKTPPILNCNATTILLNGTSPGATLLWSGPTGATITNPTSQTPTINLQGRYYLTATGTNGCISKDSTDVTGDYTKPANVSINAPGLLSCNSTSLILTGNTTTLLSTYKWSASNGGNIITATNNEQITINATGDYKMVVTHPASFCKDSASVTVSQNISAPTISFALVPAPITCSQTTSTLNATVNPANSILNWTGPGTISDPTITNPTVGASGTYTLTATHPVTGCKSTATLVVPENKTAPDLSIAPTQTITCTVPNVALDATTSVSNYTALWTTSNGTLSGSTNNIDAIAASAGLYTLTLTNNTNGCAITQNVLVNANNSAPNVMVDTNPDKLTCKITQTKLYGSSSTPGASLLWTGPGNITGPATQEPLVDAVGNYTLTVTGTNGCIASAIVTVTEDKTIPPVPGILPPAAITCTNTNVNLQASPLIADVDYLWTTTGTDPIQNKTTAIATVSTIGSYTVIVTNRISGCTNQRSVVVTENKAIPTATITGGPYELSCTTSSVQLNGSTSTGINPVWVATAGGNIVSGPNTLTPTVNGVGTYTLTMTHATTGCTHSANVTVTKSADIPGLTIDAFPNEITCANSQVTLNGQPTEGGTTFIWTANPGNIVSGADTYNPIVNQPGTYILSVTKTATGCVNTASVTIRENKLAPQVNITTPNQLTCTRTQVQINASSPNAGISWAWTTSGMGSIKPGDESVSNPIVYAAATYTLTLTSLSNQCATVRNVIVSENKTLPNINVNKSPAQLTCNVRNITLSGTSSTSNVTYLWSTLGTGTILNPTSKTPAVDAIGTYTLLVTDTINGCSISDNVIVTENTTVPDIWVNTTPGILNCAKDTVYLKGNSTTPNVSYSWVGPGNISNAAAKEPYVDAPGIYQLTVTASSNGCSATLPVTITRNTTLPAAPVATGNYSCFGTPVNAMTAIGNNAKWYNNPLLGTINRVNTGNSYTPALLTNVGDYYYYITQTDPVSQCEGPAIQVTYTIRSLPASPGNIDQSICQGLPNPTLQALGTSIRWYDTPGGNLLLNGNLYTPPVSVTSPGTYTYYATQTDAFGCQSQAKGVSLVIHPNPSAPIVSPNNHSICYGLPNPAFSASGTNIKWYTNSTLPAPVQTGGTFIPIENAVGTYNYYVTQTSTHGCQGPYATINFTIKPLPAQFIVTGGGVYCANGAGMPVGLSGSENGTSYQLLLNNTTIITSLAGNGNPLDFGLQKAEGNYTIKAIGANLCETNMIGGVTINTNQLPGNAGLISGLSAICQGATNISYSVPAIPNATSYTWTLPTGATIASGLNSNAITVDFGTNATTGQITVYASNNCGSGLISPNLQVVVTNLPAAAGNIKYTPVNDIICLGDTGIIYEVDPIANATTYQWVLPTGATIYSGANTRQIRVRFAPNAALGSQVVRVRGVNNCGNGAYSNPYAITVNAKPSITAGVDQNICSAQTLLQGSAPGAGNGKWSLVSGYALFTDDSQNNTQVNSLAQGINTFEWKVTVNGCSSKDTVNIYNNTLYVDAGQDLAICSTDVTLNGSALPSGTNGLWNVVSGSATLASASQPNSKASNFGYGDTKLYWTVTKNGCESRDSVTVTNYRPSTPMAGGDQIICIDNGWLSANQPIYGTGRWSLISGSATIANPFQTNTQITKVAVGKNVLVWTITNMICSLSDTIVIWNNSNPVNAGYDQILCDNRTTLDASPPPTGANGQWSVLQGSASFLDPKIYNTKVSGLINGVNILVWSIEKGSCTNYDTVTLISNIPTQAKAGPDQTIPSSFTTMEGNMPVVGSGKWSIISGAGLFNNDTLYNTTVANLNPGINIFRWSITYKGCSTYDDVVITNGTLETIDAGPNQIICSNQTTLEASKPLFGFGVWTVQKGSAKFENNEQFNTKVTELMAGENILRWSVTISGIEFYDTVVIVNNLPTISMVGPKQVLCGDSSILTGNTAIIGTGRWTLEGGSAIIHDPNSASSKVTNLGNGINIFRWTITQGTCVSSKTLTITNDIPSPAYAGIDETLCDNKTSLMPNSPTIGFGEWSVVSGSGIFNGNEVSSLAPGKNTLRWTIRNNNCSLYDDVVITSYKPTPANAGNNVIVCVDSVYLAANKANTALGEVAYWTLMNGSGTIADSSLNSSMVRRLAQGINVFRWTINNNGCFSNDDVEINYAFVNSIAGTDITICQDRTVLNANNPTMGIGEWSVIGGSGTAVFVNPNSPNTEVRNLDQGINILRWTIRNFNCLSRSELVITNNTPSTSFAGADQNLCSNTATLSARAPLIGSGKWTVLSGSGFFNDTIAFNSIVYNVGIGTNTYRWTVTNANCESTDEVVISNNRPINTYAGVDQQLCIDTAMLNANSPVVGTGVWSIVKGSGIFRDAYNPATSILYLAPDTNLLRWTVTNKQCQDYREIRIINNLPTISRAGADKIICSENVILDGNIATQGIGTWSVISGAANFANPNLYNSEARGLLRGRNVFRWRITKEGCQSHDDVMINNDLPTQPVAGTTIAVCDNTASLNGNKPAIGTGYWSKLSGNAIFIDSTLYNTQVVGLGQGSNFLQWTIKHNLCVLADVVEVKNNRTNVYAGADQKLYENTTKLYGNVPTRGFGTWSLAAGAGDIATPYSSETTITNLGEGLNTFEWSVNIEGCISRDYVQVTYFKMPTANYAVTQESGCPPLTVKFARTSSDNYPYSWYLGLDNTTSTDESPEITYENPGKYTTRLTVIGPDGKPVTKERIIVVHPKPTVSFDLIPQKIFIPEGELQCFNTSFRGSTYLWDFGDGNTSSIINPKHKYTDTGRYNIMLKVWTENQCTDSLIVENAVEVIESSIIRFPTAFTPNMSGPNGGYYNRNDYSNDVFYPIVVTGNIQNYKMEIFNRWGVLLFETNDINIGWDGYYKGKLMTQDVFIYRVTGYYNSGKKLLLTGDFLLRHR